MSVFQIVPWEEEGEEGGDVVDFAESCLLQAMREVIEGALAGEPGRVRGPGIQPAGRARRAPRGHVTQSPHSIDGKTGMLQGRGSFRVTRVA